MLERKVETLAATNSSLRDELRTYQHDPAEQSEVGVEPNPQHFRPMFDSHGPLFNTEGAAGPVPPTIEQVEEMLTPKNDYMFFPETYEEEAVGYEAGQPTEQPTGPESVQDGEETTNGVLRSESVS